MAASTPIFRRSAMRRAADTVVTALVRTGLAPSSAWLLTTTGRRSGMPRTVPVTVPELHGVRYLVAPYGVVGWVHNVRAAGEAVLRRGRTVIPVTVREVGAVEAGPVLKAYVRLAPPVRPFFSARPDDPVEAFAAEVERHPVFIASGAFPR